MEVSNARKAMARFGAFGDGVWLSQEQIEGYAVALVEGFIGDEVARGVKRADVAEYLTRAPLVDGASERWLRSELGREPDHRRHEAVRRLGAKLCEGCGEVCDGTDEHGVDQTLWIVDPRHFCGTFPGDALAVRPSNKVREYVVCLVRLCSACHLRYHGS